MDVGFIDETSRLCVFVNFAFDLTELWEKLTNFDGLFLSFLASAFLYDISHFAKMIESLL